MLILPRRFHAQPQYRVEFAADWAESIFFAQVDGHIFSFAGWQPFTQTSVQTLAASKFGIAIKTTGESTPSFYLTTPGTTFKEWSVAHVLELTSGSFDAAYSFASDSATYVIASANSGVLSIASASLTNHATFSGINAEPAFGAAVATFSTAAGDAWLYVDGVNTAYAAHTYSGSLTPDFVTLGGRYLQSNRNWRGHNHLTVGFRRALTKAEAQAISENPWQLFTSVPRRLYFDAGAAGGATITATAAALSFAGTDVSIDESINAAAGSVAFAGVQATFAEVVSAAPGEVVFSGGTTSVDESVDSTAAAVLFSGVQATVEVAGANEINCTAAAVTFTAPQAALVETVFTNTNALAFQGGTAGFTVTLEASAGEVTFEGVQGAVFAPVIVDCTAAVLSFDGGTATIIAGGGPRGRARGRRRHYGTLEPAADQPMVDFVPPESLPAAERFVSMTELLHELTPVVPASAPTDQKAAKRTRNLNALAEILKLI